jgi:hypothetical protein
MLLKLFVVHGNILCRQTNYESVVAFDTLLNNFVLPECSQPSSLLTNKKADFPLRFTWPMDADGSAGYCIAFHSFFDLPVDLVPHFF